jgi:hypothetical protein
MLEHSWSDSSKVHSQSKILQTCAHFPTHWDTQRVILLVYISETTISELTLAGPMNIQRILDLGQCQLPLEYIGVNHLGVKVHVLRSKI